MTINNSFRYFFSDVTHWTNIVKANLYLITMTLMFFIIAVIIDTPNDNAVVFPVIAVILGILLTIVVNIAIFILTIRNEAENNNICLKKTLYGLLSAFISIHIYLLFTTIELGYLEVFTGVDYIYSYNEQNYLIFLINLVITTIIFVSLTIVFHILAKNERIKRNNVFQIILYGFISLVLILSFGFYLLYILSGKPIICTGDCSEYFGMS